MNEEKNKGVIFLLFEFLEQKKIPYLVLRNYDTLPERPLEGSDIDLLIDKENERGYFDALKRAIQESDSFLLFKFQQQNCLSCFIYQKKHPLGFWLDAFNQLSSKGFVWADSSFLLKKRIWHQNGFFISPPGGEAANLFVKEVFSHSFIKERYQTKIPNLVKEDKESFFETLKPYFKEEDTRSMFQICLNGKWEEISQKRKIWWRNLVLNSLNKKPLNQILGFLNSILTYFKKSIVLQGISVAFIGPDGVGKTTLCENLKKRAGNLFFRKIYQYHSHFGFFPELGRIYQWLFGKSFSGDVFSQSKKMGFFRAFLHLFYYGLGNFLAWPLIFWLKIRGNLIIFDRYFYDFVAFNTNSRFSFQLFKMISKIIHRPNIVFVLQSSPEKIRQRKKELSLEEIKKQLEAFQNFKTLNLLPTVVINNEEDLDGVLEKITEEILKILIKNRAEK